MICKIRASRARLEFEADRLNVPLRMDPAVLRCFDRAVCARREATRCDLLPNLTQSRLFGACLTRITGASLFVFFWFVVYLIVRLFVCVRFGTVSTCYGWGDCVYVLWLGVDTWLAQANERREALMSTGAATRPQMATEIVDARSVSRRKPYHHIYGARRAVCAARGGSWCACSVRWRTIQWAVAFLIGD